MTWVLEDCPDLPKHLVGTMVGLANHANHDGAGAYPSQELLGWYARKDERSIRRDLEQLEGLGLIARGDQRMVLHLPADKRPVVYDLMMQRKRDPRPDARKGGRPKKAQVSEGPKTGGTPTSAGIPGSAENRGDAHVRPDVDVQTGGTPTSNRGDAHVPLTALEPSLEPSPRPDVAADTAAPAGVEAEQGGNPVDLETRKAAAEAIRIRGAGDGWKPEQVTSAVELALRSGHAAELVRSTLVEIAMDTDGTSSVGRLKHVLAEKARKAKVAAAPVAAPSWTEGPFKYLAPDTARCRRHPSEPDEGCGQCRGERLGAPDDDAPAGAAPSPVDGAAARELARQIATSARTGRPAPAPRAPEQDEPKIMGTAPQALAAVGARVVDALAGGRQ